CFRDEDLRVDRQPEFSQVDVEMSFVEEEDILSVIEGMMQSVLKEVRGVDLELPLPRLSYADAMARYGSDKPDLRYGLEIADVSEAVAQSGFGVFKGAVEGGGVVRGLAVPGGAALSRKQIDGLERVAKDHGARGLAWIKVGEPDTEEAFKGPPVKFLGAGEAPALAAACGAGPGDLLLFGAGDPGMVAASLGAVRGEAARVLELVDESALAPCWVVDFPLFEKAGDGSWAALHHAFTSPREEDLDLLETDPGAVNARAYDLVLNGFEIGGGSIRTHRMEVQERVFRAMGIGEEEAKEKFSWLLDALASGAPPHGGIALGVDRMAMVLLGLPGIRDVIAFPKTTSAQDLLTGAPGTISDAQLDELGVSLREAE
ncbi:MAG: aspartate--tRNA ligase, partial [Planctomycetota bacterium]